MSNLDAKILRELEHMTIQDSESSELVNYEDE